MVRRERTDTPLQALATMNDVQFVEAARVPGRDRAWKTPSASTRVWITSPPACWPVRWPPTSGSSPAAPTTDFERYYSAHPEDARKFLDDGERKPDPSLAPAEHAALTMLASQLFNLDEVLNK